MPFVELYKREEGNLCCKICINAEDEKEARAKGYMELSVIYPDPAAVKPVKPKAQ